jgi:hypothetical protein
VPGRAGERILHDRGERVRQAEVVDGDLERPLGCTDEFGERVRGVFRGLPAVGERAQLYRAAFCFCAAL